LTVRGWQLAGAFVHFFAPAGNTAPPAPVARPKHLFAAFADPATDDGSKHPRQTIEPLSAYLHTDIDDSRGKDEIEELVAGGQAIMAYGSRELPELCRQSIEYARAWTERGLPGHLLPVDSADHFTILDSLARAEGALTRALLALLGR